MLPCMRFFLEKAPHCTLSRYQLQRRQMSMSETTPADTSRHTLRQSMQKQSRQ